MPTLFAPVAWGDLAPATWAGVVFLALGVSTFGYVLWYWLRRYHLRIMLHWKV